MVNAVFHKSYREPEPVEIRNYVDRIIIINYPGLAKWIRLDKFISGKAKARNIGIAESVSCLRKSIWQRNREPELRKFFGS